MANYNNQLRREQLISPFGVGSLTVLPDGTSLIIAGLDYWFSGKSAQFKNDCELMDWRLAKRLGVEQLFSPPSINLGSDSQMGGLNKYVPRVPTLRFPTWYFCRICRKMKQMALDFVGPLRCDDSYHVGRASKAPIMAQVPYIVICKAGHIDDFPWGKWCHKSVNSACGGILRFAPSDSSNPQGTRVYCDSCSASRNLDFISATGKNERSHLSTHLQQGEEFLCSGARPWLGSPEKSSEKCRLDVWGSFRGSSNVYYPLVENSIYIPASENALPEELMALLNSRQLSAIKTFYEKDSVSSTKAARDLDKKYNYGLSIFSDNQVTDGYDEIYGLVQTKESESEEASWQNYLRKEYELFEKTLENDRLTIQEPEGGYASVVTENFDKVKLVPVLVETSAMWGFTRFESQPNLIFEAGKKMLALNRGRVLGDNSWLPAKQVKGEGIFFEFSSEKLKAWLTNQSVQDRIQAIGVNEFTRFLTASGPSATYTLIHTLSHLLIKQLVFFCGYNESSLKERIYASDGDNGMHGLLIYTASGDSEGTLGGLVRMGRPGLLEQVVEQALREAEWCSNDPICAESTNFEGEFSGRLSACYACCLIPETACESFNSFLDRSLISNSQDSSLSYF